MIGFDRAVNIYHFLSDRTPRNAPIVEPKPRTYNKWRRDDKAIVAKLKAVANVRETIEKSITLLGNLERVFTRGDKVLVKPNFNSPDPHSGSIDLAFLRAVVEILLEAGVKVTIGESAGIISHPTRNVFQKLGIYELTQSLDVNLIIFEEKDNEWVRIRVNSDHLKSVTVPRSAYEADKIVYVPCMKTHRLAVYSGALKLAFGFVHPGERRHFHLAHLQEKLSEINLCWQPDLIIMDGRKAFVSGGPDRGHLVEPGLVLASGDLLAIDVEAIKVIQSYGAKNKLPASPWQLPQIMTALKYSLGFGEGGYIVVE